MTQATAEQPTAAAGPNGPAGTVTELPALEVKCPDCQGKGYSYVGPTDQCMRCDARGFLLTDAGRQMVPAADADATPAVDASAVAVAPGNFAGANLGTAEVDPTDPEADAEPEAPESIDPAHYNADQIAVLFTTTRRTVLKWVSDGRLPRPIKFGRAARWLREVIDTFRKAGLPVAGTFSSDPEPVPPLAPPASIDCSCPTCGTKLRVGSGGTAEVTGPPAATFAPTFPRLPVAPCPSIAPRG